MEHLCTFLWPFSSSLLLEMWDTPFSNFFKKSLLFILGIQIRRINGNKAQVMLESGEIVILSFKAGNFAGVNTMSSKTTKGAVLNVASCSENVADFIALEQKCDNFHKCAKTVTLLKGTHQDTYEVSSDRGVTSGETFFPFFVSILST